MMHLLPPGYPIGKLPPEVLNAMMANKVPDFSVLPDDLQVYIHNNIDKFVKEFNKIVSCSFYPSHSTSSQKFFISAKHYHRRST